MVIFKLTKKLFYISSFMYFAFIFSEWITTTFSQEALKLCSIVQAQFSFRKYKRKKVLRVAYMFNQNSSKSSFFMLNIIFDVLMSTFFLNELDFFISCNIKMTKTSSFLLCVLIFTFLQKSYFSPSWRKQFHYLTSVSNSYIQEYPKR